MEAVLCGGNLALQLEDSVFEFLALHSHCDLGPLA